MTLSVGSGDVLWDDDDDVSNDDDDDHVGGDHDRVTSAACHPTRNFTCLSNLVLYNTCCSSLFCFVLLCFVSSKDN